MRAILVLVLLVSNSVGNPAIQHNEGWVVGLLAPALNLNLADYIPAISVGLLDHTPTTVEWATFAWAHPRIGTQATGFPDPLAPDQYALGQLELPRAWEAALGDGTLIAVLDSGVNVSHPDLATVRIAASILNDSAWSVDRCGHGTAVTGTIVAALGNGIGISGAAPNATLLPIKVLGDDCRGDTFQLAKGIVNAALSHADVISISITAGGAGAPEPPELQAAIAFASASGSLVIVAAGNSGQYAVNPPANDPNAMAVACTTRERTRCSLSSHGPEVDISAPGENILTTRTGGDYGSFTGTSLSVPYVSAVAALVKSKNPTLCADDIRVIIELSATPINGTDIGMGSGIVNAAKAVDLASSRGCGSRHVDIG